MAKRSDKPNSLKQTFAKNNQLQGLQDRVSLIRRLNSHLTKLLGDTIAKNCRIGNLDRNQIYIECANSTVSMRVQYQKMIILTEFQQNFVPDLKSIEIKINPDLVKVEKVVKIENKPMPIKAAGYLNEVAENAPDSLKKKLQNLANLAVQRNRQTDSD